MASDKESMPKLSDLVHRLQKEEDEWGSVDEKKNKLRRKQVIFITEISPKNLGGKLESVIYAKMNDSVWVGIATSKSRMMWKPWTQIIQGGLLYECKKSKELKDIRVAILGSSGCVKITGTQTPNEEDEEEEDSGDEAPRKAVVNEKPKSPKTPSGVKASSPSVNSLVEQMQSCKKRAKRYHDLLTDAYKAIEVHKKKAEEQEMRIKELEARLESKRSSPPLTPKQSSPGKENASPAHSQSSDGSVTSSPLRPTCKRRVLMG